MPLLYLDNSALKRPIYRTLKLEYALDLISESRLVLVAPEEWDDPYENLMHKHAAHQHGPNTDVAMRWYGSDLFGACWTWTPESDFAWRVYVPEGEVGVIVASTVEKLLSAIHQSEGIYAMRDCFVGEVRYLPGEEIVDIITGEGFQRNNSSSDTAHIRATGLLLKRPEFEHECEVRAIIECADRTRIRDNSFLDIPIEPNRFIDRLTVDPRIDREDFESTVARLRDAGYTGGIDQSELYRLPWGNS